ncbi:MAG: hypothetical protein WBG91_20095, partial [Syntrophobacteria bacterium]
AFPPVSLVRNRSSPKNVMSDPGQKGGGCETTSNSRHFMAVSPLKMHQIFMLALAGLRVEGEVAQVRLK